MGPPTSQPSHTGRERTLPGCKKARTSSLQPTGLEGEPSRRSYDVVEKSHSHTSLEDARVEITSPLPGLHHTPRRRAPQPSQGPSGGPPDTTTHSFIEPRAARVRGPTRTELIKPRDKKLSHQRILNAPPGPAGSAARTQNSPKFPGGSVPPASSLGKEGLPRVRFPTYATARGGRS